MDTNGIAIEGETLETRDGTRQRGERRHGETVGRSVEKFGSAFGGNGKSEGMKFLAVLDELVDVFDDVFGEG